MTAHRYRFPALVALALLPMLALAGCSAASPASPATQSTSAAKSVTNAKASKSAHVKGTAITIGAQLCTLASVQEATAALGTAKPFNDVSPQNTNDGPMCAYNGSELSPAVTVTLIGPEDGGIKDGRSSGLPLTLVPGLGQQAGVNDVEVDVILDKDHWLQVINNDSSAPISRDNLVAFTKLLVSRY